MLINTLLHGLNHIPYYPGEIAFQNLSHQYLQLTVAYHHKQNLIHLWLMKICHLLICTNICIVILSLI
nr:MAG TPA: hypothetical protein [Bacteriophage sp.]